jgi:hypothetical protein
MRTVHCRPAMARPTHTTDTRQSLSAVSQTVVVDGMADFSSFRAWQLWLEA